MASESLRRELLNIPGIADAELTGDEEAPGTVRVVLAEGADANTVGARVQDVLASRGMSSSVDPASAPPPPPGAPASVVPLHHSDQAQVSQAVEPSTTIIAGPSDEPTVVGARLGSIAVEEGQTGVVVSATAEDGRSTSVRARRDDLNAGVVAAVANLLGPRQVAPLLLEVIESTIDGTTVLTAVLERSDGRRVSGSAVVDAGPAFALGKAVWSALSP